MIKDALKLRGAIDLLKRARMHLGRNQLVNEWTGRYRNPAIEKADNTLRLALWRVEEDFRKVNQ